MLNLADFVQATLVQIASGVRAANETLSEGDKSRHHFVMEATRTPEGHTIEFDVAVTASEEGEGGAGAKAGLKVAMVVVSAQAGGKVGFSNESVSRVRFRVDTNRDLL